MDAVQRYVNLAVNIAISVGVAVYLYDGWEAAMYTVVSFAVLNAIDAAFIYLDHKFRKKDVE